MTVMERTAYPRFKRILSTKDLVEVYTPTPRSAFWRIAPPKVPPFSGWLICLVFPYMAFALPDAEVAGIDISRTLIDYANARARSMYEMFLPDFYGIGSLFTFYGEKLQGGDEPT